jgi:2,4-dienoyl-CoA reductase-like NADH-dependent reductase (Old Yellow Enzyme family)
LQLFTPFRLRSLTLRNRVVMAPMTRECAPGGVPTAAMADYYRRRAAGGTGLIITEGSPPDLEGAFGANVPRFFGAAALDAWRPIVDAVHAEGAAIFVQLWHVGAFDPALIGMGDSFTTPPQRLSPSGLAGPGRPYGRAMTQADIDRTIGAFSTAVAAARGIGFDGVEIHGAHGYLPDQFLWFGTNRRSDPYGGDHIARTRFVAELLQECRRAAGPDLLLGLRLSQWKQLDYGARIAETPQQLEQILAPLVAAGLDLLHCSTRRYWEPAFPGSDLPLAGWMRRVSGLPVITVGSVTLGTDFKAATGKIAAAAAPEQIADLERRLSAGEFDLVALGRALLSNPDWAQLVAGGQANALRAFTKADLDELL